MDLACGKKREKEEKSEFSVLTFNFTGRFDLLLVSVTSIREKRVPYTQQKT